MAERWFDIPNDSSEMARVLDEYQDERDYTVAGLGALMGMTAGDAQMNVMSQYRESLVGGSLDLSRLTPELLALVHAMGRYIRSFPQG